MSKKTQTLESYLANLTPERQAALKAVRALIFETVPQTVETIRYGMPTYEHNGQVVCALASQKHYMSLYMDVGLVETHKEALKHLNVGKSCIRFKKLEALPLDTIRRILAQTVKNQQDL
ncbi:MAG: iron chaperone [Anaerolineae bacterium]